MTYPEEFIMRTVIRSAVLIALLFTGVAQARLAANGVLPTGEQPSEATPLSTLAGQPLAK